jgi:hypothetical protein
MKNPSFSSFDWQNGLLYDYSANKFPTRVHALVGKNKFHFSATSTYFLFSFSGHAVINDVFHLPQYFYGSATGKDHFIEGSNQSKVLIVERIGTVGLFTLGGPIEKTGRLKYIDGCTDSLLVPPIKLGDACLNHLHFPENINQTMHTHPSMRIGLVTKGNGECVTPFGNVALYPGQIFIIHEDTGNKAKGIDGNEYQEGSHCFKHFIYRWMLLPITRIQISDHRMKIIQ